MRAVNCPSNREPYKNGDTAPFIVLRANGESLGFVGFIKEFKYQVPGLLGSYVRGAALNIFFICGLVVPILRARSQHSRGDAPAC